MIYFVTKNTNKYRYITSFLKDVSISQLKIETPEIQSDDNKKIAQHSALWASSKYQIPVLKEDVGLYINALKGFPGPYVSYIEDKIGAEGFLSLLSNCVNRDAYWIYSIAYCEPNSNPISFTARQDGEMLDSPRGRSGYPTDKIFMLRNCHKTIAELLDEDIYERKTSHYDLLRKYLKKTQLLSSSI